MNIKISNSEQETISLGTEFASQINLGEVIGFSGNLGSGKTHFIKGICEYFKVVDSVNSPTFLIVNEYSAVKDNFFFEVYHFDLYRIKNHNEIVNLGLDNYFKNNAVVLIEWIENADNLIIPDKLIKFSYGVNENERLIEFL
ncbi:MAG TPA: tRNA (adenosine(37)-N6)-threonylcarbamoyltransferase complex ATPase subunit type 1 TsaE [Ignavibacteria bacterium]|nr:tRNA (adenosine(37)-N6)-threonylcarbamoyltransferase complex ATPase subunit type 1 TsaE [Ignavibacteria bacterium]